MSLSVGLSSSQVFKGGFGVVDVELGYLTGLGRAMAVCGLFFFVGPDEAS